eukprot:1242432-Rhodomonas_salina.6
MNEDERESQREREGGRENEREGAESKLASSSSTVALYFSCERDTPCQYRTSRSARVGRYLAKLRHQRLDRGVLLLRIRAAGSVIVLSQCRLSPIWIRVSDTATESDTGNHIPVSGTSSLQAPPCLFTCEELHGPVLWFPRTADSVPPTSRLVPRQPPTGRVQRQDTEGLTSAVPVDSITEGCCYERGLVAAYSSQYQVARSTIGSST